MILSLVLVLEIAAAIASYSLRGQIGSMLDENLRSAMPEYYENPMVADYFDFMQTRVRFIYFLICLVRFCIRKWRQSD